MAFVPYNQYYDRQRIIWQHKWYDGSRLELTQDMNDFILTEYDSDGELVYYEDEEGTPTCEERYSKRRWKLNDVIQDIKQEYDMRG